MKALPVEVRYLVEEAREFAAAVAIGGVLRFIAPKEYREWLLSTLEAGTPGGPPDRLSVDWLERALAQQRAEGRAVPARDAS